MQTGAGPFSPIRKEGLGFRRLILSCAVFIQFVPGERGDCGRPAAGLGPAQEGPVVPGAEAPAVLC